LGDFGRKRRGNESTWVQIEAAIPVHMAGTDDSAIPPKTDGNL
jgi:hypothetical protein